MLHSWAQGLKKAGLLVVPVAILVFGAAFFALAQPNTSEARAAEDYPAAGTLKISKAYYESFDTALLLPVNQVYAGDDILYILTITNISTNPESRFGSTVNIDDELSPDVMSDVHVEDIIINTTWLTDSQVEGACGVNNSYVLHCSLSTDLFSENQLRPNNNGSAEADSIQIRVKAKATVHGTSDSYQLYNRAYVYSGDDVDNDGPDCKTLADAKQVERCHSEAVVFCIVMPKIEIDKKVNKDGRVTCYYYATPENAAKGGLPNADTPRDSKGKFVIPNTVSFKDITELSGSYQSNCMNNDGGTAYFSVDYAIEEWNLIKDGAEADYKWWQPARDAISCSNYTSQSECDKAIEDKARNSFVAWKTTQVSSVNEATNGYVDDQSVRAGERIEFTLTVRNTGSAVTKGGETDGIYIYDQFDPQFFNSDDIYVQPLTGGVTCKVEQAKLTCYVNRPLAPYEPIMTTRKFTTVEAAEAWGSGDLGGDKTKSQWIQEALDKFNQDCEDQTGGAIAAAQEDLVAAEEQLAQDQAMLSQAQADRLAEQAILTSAQSELTTAKSELSTAQEERINAVARKAEAEVLLTSLKALATTEKPLTAEIAQATAAVAAWTSQISTIDGRISRLNSQISTINARITTSQNIISAHDANIWLYQYSTIPFDEQRIESLKGRISALQAGQSTCQATAAEYARFEAKQNYIAWKITQDKEIYIIPETGYEDCEVDCEGYDFGGYYENGQYGLGYLPVHDEIQIRVTAIPKQTGEIKNIAYVGGGGDLLCPNNDTNSYCHSEWVTTFISAPELHINKELRNGTDADMGVSIVKGTEAKYIIKVTNEGTADTKGMIVIHDVIPEYLEVNRTTLALTFDDASYSYEAGFCEFRGTSQHELYCRAYDTVEGGLLHRSGVWTIEFNVRVLEDAQIDSEYNKVVNYAYVYGGEDPVCNSDEILLTIQQAFYSGDINPYDRCYDYLGHTIVSPKLVVSKGVDKTPTNYGEIFNYWVTVENTGDYPTTAETTALDHLPSNVTIDTSTLSSGCVYEEDTARVTCTVGAGLKAGHKETFRYKTTSTNFSGQVVNNVTIFNPDDPDCSNDAAAINTSRCHATVSTQAMSPLLKIETSASALEVYKGGQIAYLTTVRNIGNSQTTADTVVTIQMPAALRLLGVRASKGTCRIDLHYFECTLPAGIQANEAVYISTLTQATEVSEADVTLNTSLYGGGDPGCAEQVDTEAEAESSSRLFGATAFADDTVPVDVSDSEPSSETEATTTDESDETEIKTSPDATTPSVTTGGQTITPAQPDVSTNKRCQSAASVRILERPTWASDIDDNGTGAPNAGLLSTIQAIGTVSMLGVASYMVLKSRRDFAQATI
jgi:uncharacterized repeat protein (TIGR01451 family)